MKPVGQELAEQKLAKPALARLNDELIACRRCDRLVAWREQVASQRRAAFADEQYWGRPVPAFGDLTASVVIVGLAPAAHGANRTGRMFTGDRSGDFLYASLHRCGFASQPTSSHLDDGLELAGAYITAAVRCAPPANKPTTTERDNCRGYLTGELSLLSAARIVVVLGAFSYGVMCSVLGVRPRPKFGHGMVVKLGMAEGERSDQFGLTHLLCSFHPSQQNTFTGKLTEPMLDEIFTEARRLAATSE